MHTIFVWGCVTLPKPGLPPRTLREIVRINRVWRKCAPQYALKSLLLLLLLLLLPPETGRPAPSTGHPSHGAPKPGAGHGSRAPRSETDTGCPRWFSSTYSGKWKGLRKVNSLIIIFSLRLAKSIRKSIYKVML